MPATHFKQVVWRQETIWKHNKSTKHPFGTFHTQINMLISNRWWYSTRILIPKLGNTVNKHCWLHFVLIYFTLRLKFVSIRVVNTFHFREMVITIYPSWHHPHKAQNFTTSRNWEFLANFLSFFLFFLTLYIIFVIWGLEIWRQTTWGKEKNKYI